MPEINPFLVARLFKPSTRLPLLPPVERHVSRDFGWFWGPTERVNFLTADLHRLGQVVYVWETPQFKAIEWLAQKQPMHFPATFDEGLHGAFCRILSMEAICRRPMLQGDLENAIKSIEVASQKMVAAADEIFSIQSEVFDFIKRRPTRFGPVIDNLGRAQAAMATSLGAIDGVLKSQRKFQQEVYERFSGHSPWKGRPPNWVARFIATQAADIYRTTYSGPIVQSRGYDRPSFEAFLTKFSESYPEAESADKRELARHVWKGGYAGVPFASI